ncbi:4-hydroxyproline epimerase [Maricaulis sp.]|uniref:4-hydroxyproline epimerase n=1 Tax=Maricaulis sp. TaxID=1486257 RepID=UPI00260867C8|nr:4-hydroxyproline epimerase [Maricaulis sp.]
MRHTFSCLDGHTCGNPVRLIMGGMPELKGTDMSAKRLDFMARHDWIRTALMFEPRGHDMMSGAIFYPPHSADADASILFVETTGCLPMCGHGTIGAITMGLENGILKPRSRDEVVLDAPAGRVRAEIEWDGERVAGVRIFNVASYLACRDVELHCPELGKLSVDIAYGGNYYAIVEPQGGYEGIDALGVDRIIALSPKLRELADAAVDVIHPENPSVRGVSHVMWTDAPKSAEADARNAVFYGKRAIDRSPCGTGTSARMAQLAARGRLQPGDTFVHESIIGSLFHGRVESATRLGEFDAIMPSIRGWALQTGINTIFVDERDPFAHGFSVTG